MARFDEPASVEERPVTTETQNVYSDTNNKRRGGGWLWWVLPLLILLGLGAFLLGNTDNDSSTSSTAKTESSQAATETDNDLKTRFETAVPMEQRTFLFTPDTTNLQDQTSADASVTQIANFFKENKEAKLVVNGSIYNGQPGDQNEQLAKQRAQLILDKLVAMGVNAASIKVTAINTYTGNTDAAQAEYARSVTVSAQ